MTDLIQLLEQAAQETNFTTNWSEHSLKFLAAFAKLVRNEALQEAKQVALRNTNPETDLVARNLDKL